MIVDIDVRNQKYNANGITVDCEINHPVFGWIPFTASPNDIEEHGREVYKAIINGKFGPIGSNL